MIRRHFANPTVQALAIAGLALLLALSGISWLALSNASQLLFPELAQKALAEADQARRKVDGALQLGIPLEHLVGVDAEFAGMKKGDGDIAFMAVADTAGQLRFLNGLPAGEYTRVMAAFEQIPAPEGLADCQSLRAGYLVTSLPLRTGVLYLGHDEESLVRPLLNNLFDIAVVVLVAMLLSFEVMLLLITSHLVRPARAAIEVLGSLAEGRGGQVTGQPGSGILGTFISQLDGFIIAAAGSCRDRLRPVDSSSVIGVRLLAFLFVFAEELARPFLPVYVGEYAARTADLDPSLATGLVVGLHMSVVALAMPFATILYSRLGRTRLYAAGALLASAGLVGTALAVGYWDLLAWRGLSAVGYAISFVACQGFVIETTRRDNRASGTAMMVGGITLADICGPAFGGVLAERFGQAATFLIAASIAALAALAVFRLMGRGQGSTEVPQRITLRDFMIAFANRRLVIQVIFAALPAKLLLTGFLFYLVPVTLVGIGWTEADVGRIVMLYGLVMLVGGPVFARLSDRWRNHAMVVAVGGVTSSIFLVVVPLLPAHAAVLAAIGTVAALGLGQSMSITAQVALVVGLAAEQEVRHGQAPELTVLRFVERFGGGLGPMIAAPLAAAFGATGAIGVFGAYGLFSAALYAALAIRPRNRQAAEEGAQ